MIPAPSRSIQEETLVVAFFPPGDAFERGDIRLRRAVQTAQRTCQEQQPKKARPSTADYERCVLAEVRSAELSAVQR